MRLLVSLAAILVLTAASASPHPVLDQRDLTSGEIADTEAATNTTAWSNPNHAALIRQLMGQPQGAILNIS